MKKRRSDTNLRKIQTEKKEKRHFSPHHFSQKTSILGDFYLLKTTFSRKVKKNFKKNRPINQQDTKIFQNFFKKYLEVMKKELPLRSQSETKGLPKRKRKARKKFFENIGNSAK
jgi:hypothetical protein